MSFLKSINISGSALTAERFRVDTILQNLANSNTTRTAEGTPYRRKQVIFEERAMSFRNVLSDKQSQLGSGGGVRVASVVESNKDFIPVYDPSHPDANEEGYVLMPNVDRTEEQVDLMAATRAYEANLMSLNIVKAMAMKAMSIGK